MNVYMPPQPRNASPERLATHRHVRDFLRQRSVPILSRTGGARSLPWLARAETMILETDAISPKDEEECFYMAEALGRQVLVLFDIAHSRAGGAPSEQLLGASRQTGNENSNLWIVHQRPTLHMPHMVIDSALEVFVGTNFGIKAPIPSQAGNVQPY